MLVSQERGSVNSSLWIRVTYNLFRSRGDTPLYCAVAEDAPVPSFIVSDRWGFAGRVEEPRRALGGEAEASPDGRDRFLVFTPPGAASREAER